LKKQEIWGDKLVRDKLLKKTYSSEGVETGNSKTAFTQVKPLMKNNAVTLILAEIETGRTHQIRAQAAFRGHPLLGDKKYGGAAMPGGFMLHAWRMEFPENAESWATLPILIEAPLSDNFQRKVLELFGEGFNSHLVL
jgi:23S rRNA pseudouridine955/2504/2580 synthase